MGSVYGNWTVKASLIRNLGEVSGFGTVRVIEEGVGSSEKQGKGNRE
jgi:hypothetical protein